MKLLSLIIICTSIGCSSSSYLNENCSMTIHEYVAHDFSYYQCSSVRTYFSPQFLIGYSVPWDSTRLATEKYNRQISNYISLFRRGLLTGEMMIKAMSADGQSVDLMPKNWSSFPQKKDSSLQQSLSSFEGDVVKILECSSVDAWEFKSTLKFTIGAAIGKYEDGWGSTAYFTVTITSATYYRNGNTKDFIKNARKVHVDFNGFVI